MTGRTQRIALLGCLSVLVAGAAAQPAGAAPTCDGKRADIVRGDGDNTVFGTSGNDVIVLRGGDDVVDGRGGRDRICGGDGRDDLFGSRAPMCCSAEAAATT